MKYKKLFTPVKIGTCEIKNRFSMAPMGPLGLSDSEGGWNQRGIDYYTERAKGGTGLIITGVTFPCRPRGIFDGSICNFHVQSAE